MQVVEALLVEVVLDALESLQIFKHSAAFQNNCELAICQKCLMKDYLVEMLDGLLGLATLENRKAMPLRELHAFYLDALVKLSENRQLEGVLLDTVVKESVLRLDQR